MKKKLVYCLVSAMMLLTLFTGCKKKEAQMIEENPKETGKEELDLEKLIGVEEKAVPTLKPGAYKHSYTDNIDGQDIEINSYIMLNEDGTGFYIVQDDLKLTWDENSITDENGNELKFTLKDEGTIVIDENGIEVEYSICGSSLPDDVIAMMRYNLDGSIKIDNSEAKAEYNSILTADKINFYDYEGNVSYSGSGDALNDMKAAYYEITDKKLPLLFIMAPDAPHYAGYTHMLQYFDEEIADVVALDDVSDLYVESGLVSLTYTGGGYGETNYYYYVPNESGYLIEVASKIVMEDEGYAADYKENFGEDFQNMYYIYDRDDSEALYDYVLVEKTEDEFNSWFEDITKGEASVKIDWKPLEEAVK